MEAKEVTDAAEKPKTGPEWLAYWTAEFKAARNAVRTWHEQCDKIDRILRDERQGNEVEDSRLELFYADLQTREAMLYGKPPEVAVDRRHADAADDDARVASTILERLLNTDIERKSDGYRSALRYALKDRQRGGWGLARVRYVMEEEEVPETPAITDEATGQELAPAVPKTMRKVFEDVETDYVHWRDQLWSPRRIFHEMGWWAHRAQLSRDDLVEEFGEEVAKDVPLNGKDLAARETDAETRDHPWGRADVWEIWSKDHETVFWFVESYGVLRSKPDPYELEGFFPFPEPMAVLPTTSKLVPRPDYTVTQDIDREIDVVSARIQRLTKAMRVTGTYDGGVPEIGLMLEETYDGKMIPAENWGKFVEKGGLKGSTDWFPLEMVANALALLVERRRELIDLRHQLAGSSDLMRGQASTPNVTASEQRIKAKFGSVRIQAQQDEFARFASGLQDLRAQLIAKFFDKATILQRCNCEFTADADRASAAVDLIKSDVSKWRIEVKPESINLQDFAALKEERTEVLTALGGFFQSMAPITQSMPGSLPFVLEMAQWFVAGLRGAKSIEGVFDRAIEGAKAQAAQPQPQQAPDPKLITQQMKGQQDLQKIQAELQADLVRTNAEVTADAQREENQATWNVREAAQKQAVSNAMKPMQPMKPGGRFP